MRTVAAFAALALFAPSAELYRERYRPQFHFSPERNWTNDPCGLIYRNGEYHLFFQFNPFDKVWGHMSWGHAISRDLVHWKQLPVAIPEDGDVMIFTGSSVLRGKRIVSIWTGDVARRPQTQNLAFSADGRTWTKYPGNPVLDQGKKDFRDPKVLWHAATKRWIMVVMLPNEYKAQFYSSRDLKHWIHLSDFGPADVTREQWECPDFYQLPVDGNPKNTRWVLKIGTNPGHIAGGSGEQYFVGRFDGIRFTNDNPPETSLWVDYGRDCYCEFSFNNAPATIAMGWMSDWLYAGETPTSPWRGQMTIPRRLSLQTTPEGIRLVQTPIEGLKALRRERLSALAEAGDTFEFTGAIAPGREFRLALAGAELAYDPAKSEIYVDRTQGNVNFSPKFPARTAAPVQLHGRPLKLHVFVDRSSIEVFADGGRVTLTNLVYPTESRPPVILQGAIDNLEVWKLASIWR
ncbi:MAG TPA: glycoside hydrolase family 32 protein [Bryobacteraceae bacterium]|nr:glycoside hydrolase family 32 protein [Bryobacteraceae bacterium]